MCKRFFFLPLLFVAATASAQWSWSTDGSLFATYVTQTGPQKPANRTFSTNWLTLTGSHSFAGGTLTLRGHGSLEPLTVPAGGSPQLLQYVGPENGTPYLDRAPAQPFLQELSVRQSWRWFNIQLAPVGHPTLGVTPYELRGSSREFAEQPFAYDVQETPLFATRVASIGIGNDSVSLEGSAFHHALLVGQRSRLDDGDIDSWAARLNLGIIDGLRAQLSRGRLTRGEQVISSASLTYDGTRASTSLMFTRRQPRVGDKSDAISLETALRAGTRNTLMGRLELVDRPVGVFTDKRRTTHVTFGYLIDVFGMRGYRAGIGANVDYQTNTHELQSRYGHKPQSVFLYFRLRATPPAST